MEIEVLQAAGLTVRIYRGREAPDPSHPDYGDASIAREDTAAMCRDLERVRDAQSIGLNAQTAACKRTVTFPDSTKQILKCPLFDAARISGNAR